MGLTFSVLLRFNMPFRLGAYSCITWGFIEIVPHPIHDSESPPAKYPDIHHVSLGNADQDPA